MPSSACPLTAEARVCSPSVPGPVPDADRGPRRGTQKAEGGEPQARRELGGRARLSVGTCGRTEPPAQATCGQMAWASPPSKVQRAQVWHLPASSARPPAGPGPPHHRASAWHQRRRHRFHHRRRSPPPAAPSGDRPHWKPGEAGPSGSQGPGGRRGPRVVGAAQSFPGQRLSPGQREESPTPRRARDSAVGWPAGTKTRQPGPQGFLPAAMM